MVKRSSNPPKDTVKLLPPWHEDILDEHFKGLPGLYVRQLLDKASAADRSVSATKRVSERHKKRNEVKSLARDYYLANRDRYRSNKEAARDLYNQFKSAEFRTYVNWVSKWSSE